MNRPLILVADGDGESLERTTQELDRRWGGDFLIHVVRLIADAKDVLEGARVDGARVALALIAPDLPDGDGGDLLRMVRLTHPDAKRALLVPWGVWGDPEVAATILTAMSLGEINYYVLKPWTTPDELFHRSIAELIHEWSRTDPLRKGEVVVAADEWSLRGHELRRVLGQSGIPIVFHSRGTDAGLQIMVAHGLSEAPSSDVYVFMPALGRQVLVNRPNGQWRCRSSRNMRTTGCVLRQWVVSHLSLEYAEEQGASTA